MRGGKTSPRDGAEATPEQTNPVRTAGPVRGREKPKEIIVGFFNQDPFVAQLIGVLLTTPFFSCNLWRPCPEPENGPESIDLMVFDFVNSIRQIDPDLSDTIKTSEYRYWSPLDGPVEI